MDQFDTRVNNSENLSKISTKASLKLMEKDGRAINSISFTA